VLNANKQLAGKTGKDGIKLEGRLLFFDAGGDPRELMSYMVKSEFSQDGPPLASRADT